MFIFSIRDNDLTGKKRTGLKAKWSQNDQDGQLTLTCFKPAQSVGLYEFLSRSAEKTYVRFPERVKIVYCCIYDKITEVRRNV